MGRLLFAAVLVDLVGFGIVMPLLPSRAAEFTSSRAAVGVIVAAFSCMQFLLASWWGRLSDRIGRRPVLVLGFLASGVSYLVFGLTEGFALLLLSRILAGGVGATVNVSQAALADVTPPASRSRAMALIGVAFGLGFILGPAIAALTSHGGVALPGVIAALLCGCSAALTWLALPETAAPRPATETLPDWRPLAGPAAAMFLSVVAFAAITVIFPLFAAVELGMGRRSVSAWFVVMGVASAVVQARAVGWLAPRVGERRLMGWGGVLLAVGLAVVPFANQGGVPESLRVPVFGLALVLLASGSALLWPAAAARVSTLVPPGQQGQALGTLHSIASLARVVGPIAIGLAGETVGFQGAFLGAAVLALAAGAVGLRR